MQHVLLTRLLRAARKRGGLNLCRVMVRPIGAACRERIWDTSIDYRPLGEAQLLPFCCELMELDRAQCRAAFARGDLCVGAFHRSLLVGYLWLAFSPTPHTQGVWVDFADELRYSYKLFVHPDYRGRRVAHGMWALADAPKLSRGRFYDISFIDCDNTPSLKANLRVGAEAVALAGFMRCLGSVWTFQSAGAQRWGFRFYVPSAEAGEAEEAPSPEAT